MSMGIRRTGTRAAETELRKSRLLEAAVALAAEGGYEAVQMRDVAAHAEVALGPLYRHYASKDQLLLALMLDQTQQLRQRLEQHPIPGDTPADRVSEVLVRACRALERERKVTGAFVRAMFSVEPDASETMLAVQREMHAIIAIAMRGGANQDDDAIVEGIVDVLGHVWFSAMSFWALGRTRGSSTSDQHTTAAHRLLDR